VPPTVPQVNSGLRVVHTIALLLSLSPGAMCLSATKPAKTKCSSAPLLGLSQGCSCLMTSLWFQLKWTLLTSLLWNLKVSFSPTSLCTFNLLLPCWLSGGRNLSSVSVLAFKRFLIIVFWLEWNSVSEFTWSGGELSPWACLAFSSLWCCLPLASLLWMREGCVEEGALRWPL
jgi:hypothetical protein